MYAKNQYDEKTRWPSFMAGALLGAGAALLVAPQTGRELRNMLCHYATRMKQDLFDKAEEANDKGEAVIQDAGRPQGSSPNRERRRAGQSIKEFA